MKLKEKLSTLSTSKLWTEVVDVEPAFVSPRVGLKSIASCNKKRPLGCLCSVSILVAVYVGIDS